MSKWATFRAAWKASEGPRGRAIDPTLYSEECLAKWLPLKLSTGLLALLWFLIFYDLFFLIVGLEGTAADWIWWIDGVYVASFHPRSPISNTVQGFVLLVVFLYVCPRLSTVHACAA